MKERLLRLHTVSNRCREEEGGREGKSQAGRRSRANRCEESWGNEISPGRGGFEGDSRSGEAKINVLSLFSNKTNPVFKLYLIIKDVVLVINRSGYIPFK